MEGNECYKFSTLANYLGLTGAAPIQLAIDIGANVGKVSLMMRSYFPTAQIYAFEPVKEYYLRACKAVRSDPYIKVIPAAVCGSHLFEDDLGFVRRAETGGLRILKALPAGGIGWGGGSMVLPKEDESFDPRCYCPLTDSVNALTLDQVVSICCSLAGVTEVDLIKIDCEGCEVSSLGCASLDTLRQIRFIAGEYHDIDRFYQVMKAKLFETHFVNLVGDRGLGAFFCERKGERRTMLRETRDNMLHVRPWLSDQPLDWHVFRDEFVLHHERGFHGL